MMKEEFDKLVGLVTAPEVYERIEFVYMNSDKFQTKQQLAEFYKLHNMNGIEKEYKAILELEKNKVKHFEVQIKASAHVYTFGCTGMYEALEAITDAAATFGFEVDVDDVMQTLVNMKNGITVAMHAFKWGVFLKDGEV